MIPETMRQQIKMELCVDQLIPHLTTPIFLSFYFPNKLAAARRGIVLQSEIKEEKAVDSTDVIGVVAQMYARLTTWRKLHLFELLYVCVVCVVCILRHDVFNIIELFIVLTLGMSSPLMIPYWVYKMILGVATISIMSKYFVQLPLFNQCVNSDGIMELFFLVILFSCVLCRKHVRIRPILIESDSNFLASWGFSTDVELILHSMVLQL